jgi:hypothetical protein
MINVSRTLRVNRTDAGEPCLTWDDVWAGLLDKAENPLPYVKAITESTVVERSETGLVRDIICVGEPIREIITFTPKTSVHFERVSGRVLGTIDNKIGTDAEGELELTFGFSLTVEGMKPGSPEESEFALQMEKDYLSAVETTLNAVRARRARV